MRSSYPTFVLEEERIGEDVARAIIESGLQKEPFYIFDTDKAYGRIQRFKKALPRVKVFYAMKANDDEAMLKLAISQGLGFDCASPGEINKARRLGVSSQSLIYAAPIKTPEQMQYARASGIQVTTFDNIYELKKLKQYWPDVNALIRVRVDADSVYKLGDKFGCDFESEATDLLEQAARLGIQVAGVAFHVGSACFSLESYEVALTYAKKLFDHEESAGRGMKIVDIGGGFLSDLDSRIDDVAELINQKLEELFPDPSVQIIAEPGRYLCDSAFTLYSNINNIRRVTQDNKPVTMIYINDGCYGTMRFPEAWHSVYKLKSANEQESDKMEEVILWGPSCDSWDRVMGDRTIYLPECSPVDWLCFPHQGAYTKAFATTFSCLPLPKVKKIVTAQLSEQLRDAPVYSRGEFLCSPDITLSLPGSLPSPLPSDGICEANCNRLIV